MSECGIGGWNGPLPGDPSSNSILSAVSAFGGIDVFWTYPTTNPFAVAYTKLYRGVTANFADATLLREVAGTYWFDRLESGTYYYWIQFISVHGTPGEVIGPDSASPKSLLDGMLEELTGKIDSGLLAITLKNQLDQISILNANLLEEIFDRETGQTSLADAIAAAQEGIAEAHTFILDEINTRTTETSALAEQIDGIAATLGDDFAAVFTAMTIQLDSLTGTVDAMWVAKVNVNGLVGGFGLHNDGETVEAGFDVDTFWVGRTAGDKVKPFIVSGGTTYIKEAVIPTLTAGKIDTRGLDIRDAMGNVILSAGTPLAAAYASTALRNSNITVNADGTLSGAGGGAVTIAGLDNTVIRSGNQITAGNIATYIAAAAIGSAYIGNLSVDTFHIKNNAITVSQRLTAADASSVNGTAHTAFSFTPPAGGAHIGVYSFTAQPEAGSVDAYGEAIVIADGLWVGYSRFGIRVTGGSAHYSIPVMVPFSAAGGIPLTAIVRAVNNPGGSLIPLDLDDFSLIIMSGKK